MYKQIDANKQKTVVLIFGFLILVIGLGWVLGYLLDRVWILPLAVVGATVQALVSYYYSDKITLAISRAKKVPRQEPFLELHRIVENLAIAAGLPKPEIYLIEDSAPNAFATGRDPKHAAIAVTQGLLEKLNKTELEGVLSHELAHIGNYDIRLMTLVVVLYGIIALISDWFLRALWFRDRDEDKNALLLLIGVVLAILAPLAALLIQLAISRKREYLADATGALLTRYPEGLASALEKIAADPEPLEVANRATAHLYIVNPFKGKTLLTLFSTHPPIEDRIKKLREMI